MLNAPPARGQDAEAIYRRQAQAEVAAAASFHQALAAAAAGTPEGQAEAVRLFETYLRGAAPGSAWWPLAYERYAALCQTLGQSAKPAADLRPARPAALRVIRAVTLTTGAAVAVGEEVDEVTRRLGPPATAEAVPGLALRRLRFPSHGIELLADESNVIAVSVTGAAGPGLPLHLRGAASGAVGELKVGLPRREVERLLGGIGVHRPLTRYGTHYHYYRGLGVAVRYDRPGPDGVAVELAVVQIPDGDYGPDDRGRYN
jgi:hypothetical protein